MNYFDFVPKKFFLKFELPNSGCGLCVSMAYPPVSTINLEKNLTSNNFTLGHNEMISAEWKNYYKHNLRFHCSIINTS